MVQFKTYCPEQIVVPEKFPNILKSYTKAVIKTQPYDLLRWSAAYFRCMASNIPPPVKARLEKETSFGKLTKGFLRVLLEQLGRGFFVEREILQLRWTSLSLPEEELLRFLSLCRMLHWSQIHWLELFAVMVGSLNDTFHSTVEMICELLTDDPEGGPNSIPVWMFNVCYSFIAKLDCSEAQTFINGRKVSDDDETEDLNKEPKPPKIPSLDLFRYALIERFIQKEHRKLHQETDDKDMTPETSSQVSCYSDVSTNFNFVELDDPEGVMRRTKDFESIMTLLNEGQREALRNFNDPYTRDKVIQHLLIERKSKKNVSNEHDNASLNSLAGSFSATARSDISSSFKFVGDLKNPYEFIKKTPHTNSVFFILSKTQRSTLRNFTERLTSDERVKEELFRNMSRIEDSPEKCEIPISANSTVVSKGLEPPWSWIHQFASLNSTEKSYNFVERESPAPSSETPSLLTTDGSFDFERGRFRDSSVSDTDPETTSEEDNQKMVDNFIVKVIDKVGQAVSDGKCDIKNVKSVCSTIESDPTLNEKKENTNIIIEKLKEADENLTAFENLEQLDTYLKNECADALSKVFMDCDIEFDENTMAKAKEVPTDMILGLVDKSESAVSDGLTSEAQKTIDQIHISSTSLDERNENAEIVDDFMNDVIGNFEKAGQISATDQNKINFPQFECTIPELPGIGKDCSQETMERFLNFIVSRAREEKGMVFTRFFKEVECPVMTDNFY